MVEAPSSTSPASASGGDPQALSRVSYATGLNVVMGAGWYQKLYHPVDMDEKTIEEMTDEIIRDITVGVGDTGIRSGIIGEVGIEGAPITDNEVKSIRASGRASRATGAPISFHRGGVGREKLAVIGMLGEEGTDMSRVIFGHSDPIAGDLDLMLELLGHGVYIQFDLLGRLGADLRHVPDGDDFGTFFSSAGTAAVAEAIPQLIDAGYADRILLAQDVCGKVQLKKYGGTGYSFIMERFLPELRSRVCRRRAHRDDDGGEPAAHFDVRGAAGVGGVLTTDQVGASSNAELGYAWHPRMQNVGSGISRKRRRWYQTVR